MERSKQESRFKKCELLTSGSLFLALVSTYVSEFISGMLFIISASNVPLIISGVASFLSLLRRYRATPSFVGCINTKFPISSQLHSALEVFRS